MEISHCYRKAEQSESKERDFHNLPVRAVIQNLKHSQGKVLRKGHKVPVLTTSWLNIYTGLISQGYLAEIIQSLIPVFNAIFLNLRLKKLYNCCVNYGS